MTHRASAGAPGGVGGGGTAMDDRGVDGAARTLARVGSRRAALRLAAGGALAALPARVGRDDAAAACRKNGRECSRGGQCCSGVCKRRTCRAAPGQGICTIASDNCAGTDRGCKEGQPCSCYATARGARFCGANFDQVCSSRDRDEDCAFVTGPGSACIRLTATCGCAGDDRGFTRKCVPRC